MKGRPRGRERGVVEGEGNRDGTGSGTLRVRFRLPVDDYGSVDKRTRSRPGHLVTKGGPGLGYRFLGQWRDVVPRTRKEGKTSGTESVWRGFRDCGTGSRDKDLPPVRGVGGPGRRGRYQVGLQDDAGFCLGTPSSTTTVEWSHSPRPDERPRTSRSRPYPRISMESLSETHWSTTWLHRPVTSLEPMDRPGTSVRLVTEG